MLITIPTTEASEGRRIPRGGHCRHLGRNSSLLNWTLLSLAGHLASVALPTGVLQALGEPRTPPPRWAGGRALPGENNLSQIVTGVSFRGEIWDWVSLTQKLGFFFRTILPTTLLNCAPSKYIWICNSVRPFLCSRMGNSVAYFTYTLFDCSFECPNIVPLIEGKTGSLDPRSRGCVSFILSSVPSSGEGVNLCW